MSRTISYRDRLDADRLWSALKREIDKHGGTVMASRLPRDTAENLTDRANAAGIAVIDRGDGLAFSRLWDEEAA